MDANIMNLFIFVFCILFVNIDKTVVCASVKSIKSLSLSLSLITVMMSFATCNKKVILSYNLVPAVLLWPGNTKHIKRGHSGEIL